MATRHGFWRKTVVDALKSTPRALSPLRLLLVVTISVFLAETIVMFFLALLPPLPMLLEALLDALLLSVVILPVLYTFLFRPVTVHILKREQAEAAYQDSEERYRQLTDNIHKVFW